MRNFFLIPILFAVLLSQLTADPSDDFAAANQAFIAGEFGKAYSGYQRLLDDGNINADLLYNIGTASYRLKRPGEAVLWFERTLVLDPAHREARQNLRFLKRTSGILQFDEAGLGLGGIRRDTLVRIATVAGWLAVLGIAAALTLRLGSGAKTCLWIACPLLAVVGIAAAAGVYLKHRSLENLSARVIVTAADSKASTSPARTADTVIRLPEGTQLLRLSKRGSWDYIDIPGELRGWVPEGSVTPLWPYDPNLAD